MKYTVTIPCYNSEKFLEKTVKCVISEMDLIAFDDYEIILVNDCSKDKTFDVIRKLSMENKQVKGLDLAKNVGQHNAILTALRDGKGDVFINLDDDLQCNPKDIKFLLDRLYSTDSDVVYAKFMNKKYTFIKKLTSNMHNFIINWLLDKNDNWVASSFWVAKKLVIERIINYKSDYTDMQSNFIKSTRYIVNQEVMHCDRIDGNSGYTFAKSFKLWISILNYSEKVAIFLMKLGIIIPLILIFLGFVLGIFNIEKFKFSTLISSLIMGVILFCTGFLSLQIGRVLRITAEVPFVTIREKVGRNLED